jgi:hypothetical protein
MDIFFRDLGRSVLERWKRKNFSLAEFPKIARETLEEKPPSDHVDLSVLMREFLLRDDQPPQTQSGFGQPELVAFDHPRFYVQLLFWLDGTTAIHQHEFSGAFHVLHGSSIHARYEFDHPRPVTPYFCLGVVRSKSIELLETGRTVSIVSGRSGIHSLFHLDTPSVTVVVRTQHDPGTGPQFNYLPPHIAIDPVHDDSVTLRRRQLLAVLEQTNDPAYPKLVREMIGELDLERGFFILQESMEYLRDIGEWKSVLRVFRKKHGSLAAGVVPTLEECVRRDLIKNFRSTTTDPEHRFFLALLMNVPARGHLLKLVAQRIPNVNPVETVLRWAEELAEVSECGMSILDAGFPESWRCPVERQFGLFLPALRYFATRGPRVPMALRALSAAKMKQLHAAFAASTLRVLVV